MANNYVTLDHFDATIGELRALLIGGFETMNVRFDRLGERVERLELRMDALEAGQQSLEVSQQETNQRLDRIELAQQETNIRLDLIEGTLIAHYADIKELYRLLAETKRHYSKQLARNKDLNKRLLRVEKFAQEIAARTGLPYK